MVSKNNLHGNDFPVRAACVTIPEKANIARRPFFNSLILYFSRLAGLDPSFKGSKEKSPGARST